MFIQRLTSDTSRLADIFNVLNLYLSRILINIGIFIAVFIINFWAFLYLVVMVFILYLVERRGVKIYNIRDKEFRKESERVTGFVGEIVRGIRDIKMLHSEDSFSAELYDQVHGDFCFSHVDFHYDSNDKKVLNDLSFEVHANETVAFVGKSGVGKTTIFNLLCKMYDIDNGMITIDGIDIRELD